jgi:hypothetical protein
VKNVFTANELLFRIADQTASCYCQAAASARNILRPGFQALGPSLVAATFRKP